MDKFASLKPGWLARWSKLPHEGSTQARIRAVVPDILHGLPTCKFVKGDLQKLIIQKLPDLHAEFIKHGKRPDTEVAKCISNFIREGWLQVALVRGDAVAGHQRGWQGNQRVA
jgi:hypothetical protein